MIYQPLPIEKPGGADEVQLNLEKSVKVFDRFFYLSSSVSHSDGLGRVGPGHGGGQVGDSG